MHPCRVYSLTFGERIQILNMKQSCGWLGKVKTNIETPHSGMKDADFRTPIYKMHYLNHESMLQRLRLGSF
jgi:hypothetical protein